jgi:hypothetical protein
MKHALVLILTLSLGLLAAACSGDEPAADAPAASADEHAGHDHAAHMADAAMASPEEIAAAVAALPAETWYCPMHPEENDEVKERCGKCNMHYVQKPAEAAAPEAPAAEDHSGHDHSAH